MKIPKQSKKDAIVINIISGPGTGKSILTSDLFSLLKRKYISCEISSEYIKRKIREQAVKVLTNQVYIFAKQQFQLFSMKTDVDVVVTDSPFILCAIYDANECDIFKELVLKEFNKYNNLTYFIERDNNVEYEKEGRFQDLKGAKKVDIKVKKFLDDNKLPYTTVRGIGKKTLNKIIKDVEKELKNDKRN